MREGTDLSEHTFLLKFYALLAVFFVFLLFVGSGFDVFSIFVHRKAVEQSIQYAETNTQAFYTAVEGIKSIDVQLAGLPPGDPQIAPLQSQRAFLVKEAHRAVAKIPVDARTPEMSFYQGVQ